MFQLSTVLKHVSLFVLLVFCIAGVSQGISYAQAVKFTKQVQTKSVSGSKKPVSNQSKPVSDDKKPVSAVKAKPVSQFAK